MLDYEREKERGVGEKRRCWRRSFWSSALSSLTAPEDVPALLAAAEGLLRGVDHVEEAVLVSLLLVDLRDGRRHRHHAVLVDQQEEGLRGVQLQSAPGGRKREDYGAAATGSPTLSLL